jgi:hypothetical protein
MKASWMNRGALVLAGVVLGLALAVVFRAQAVRGREDAPAPAARPAPRYTVIETEGHNLLVTDNQTNIVYFYTTDKDAKIGSDLKLRGTIDLKQVGKPVIRPKKARAEKE